MGNKIPKFDNCEVGQHTTRIDTSLHIFIWYTLINKYKECCIYLAALNSTMLPKNNQTKNEFKLANS